MNTFTIFEIERIIEKNDFIDRKACDMYKNEDSSSVDFIMSSLLFEIMKEDCEVKDFF